MDKGERGGGWTELRSVQPASVFALLFSACFIIALVCLLAVNLRIIGGSAQEILQGVRDRIDPLGPWKRSLAYALLIGVSGGVGGMLLTLIYNVFADIVGGVKGRGRN
ncbi:MAG: hypothetical protein PHN82_11250 [bacterium]|nr:hypothetical protein [bacterium]